jgi:hypothetical protein
MMYNVIKSCEQIYHTIYIQIRVAQVALIPLLGRRSTNGAAEKLIRRSQASNPSAELEPGRKG